MSNSLDPVPVPTNGHRPPLASDEVTPSEEPAAAAAPSAPAAPATDEFRVAVSPGQLAAGFGIIAALILLVVGRRRGKRG